MAMRTPQDIARLVNPENGMSMVEAEIMAETASSLGHHGRKVEAALAALTDAKEDAIKADLDQLTHKAAREVWAYFIQREFCGMRDHRLIIKEMGIPQSVLVRLGAVR